MIEKCELPNGVDDLREIVQVVFSLRTWSPRQAKTWAALRGFKIDSMRVTEYSVVLRQRNDSEVVKRTMREEPTSPEGIQFVTACAKEVLHTLRGSLHVMKKKQKVALMSDQTLKCEDCGDEFVFTAKDQQFYAEKQFTPPKRCKSCRAIRKAQREHG